MEALIFFGLIGFLVFIIVGCALGKGGVVLIITGILLSAASGVFYARSSGNMASGDFWWDYYGTARYSEEAMIKNITFILIFVGIAMIIIGAIVCAHAGRKNVCAERQETESRRTEAPQTVFCTACGHRISTAFRFCPDCGAEADRSQYIRMRPQERPAGQARSAS